MATPRKKTIVYTLKEAIRDSGRTHYNIGKAAGIGPEILDRFVYGERGIHLQTAAKICEALGLELKPKDD